MTHTACEDRLPSLRLYIRATKTQVHKLEEEIAETQSPGRPEVNWAIVRLQGRWLRPFPVSVPLVKVDKGAVTAPGRA